VFRPGATASASQAPPSPQASARQVVDGAQEQRAHWPDLDGLRAFAILLVLGRHSLRPFISEDAYSSVVAVGPIDVTPLVLNGWIGVDLFFVLSGFLIGRQAWRGDSLRRFWFKRVTRILPAYWACLAIVALGLTVGGAWSTSGGDFLAHVVMLQDYTGSVFVPSFWSLGAEEKFYLLAPLLVFVLTWGRVRLWQGAALFGLWLLPVMWRVAAVNDLAGVTSYADYFPKYRSPFHLTSESLVLGFAIAWISRQSWSSRISRPIREVLFWVGAAGVLYWLAPSVILHTIDAPTIVLAPALIGLCFGAMVLAAVTGSGSYSVIVGRATWQPLATGSYTLYLTHMMVLPVAAAVAARTVPLAEGASLTARWVAFLPWYLVMTACSAYLLHRYVERPVLQWRDRRLASADQSGEAIAKAA
jgi:peptidoglycan/LPS O-acetylase OafA/YrhL